MARLHYAVIQCQLMQLDKASSDHRTSQRYDSAIANDLKRAHLGVSFEGGLGDSQLVSIAILLCSLTSCLLCRTHKADLHRRPFLNTHTTHNR